MKQIVGIGSPVEYLGKSWVVRTITKQFVVLVEVVAGVETSRTTRVALKVFENL